MVGGIGVMAIMTISVTERTREIGVRKALGARRREILWQFLLEAVFLTSLGGVIGIVLGAAIGWLINILSGFPISLPWWSFALGLGFSAVGRHLLRHLPGLQGRAARSDRSAPLRVARQMAVSGLRAGLLAEILTMAVETLRANKLRSALTILGVVIGITSIVSVTALIRGFDESFKDLFRQIGPTTMFVDEVQLRQPLAGQVVPRPDQAAEPDRRRRRRDRGLAARRHGRRCSSAASIGPREERMTYGSHATKRMRVIGVTANYGQTNSIPIDAGRVFTQTEVDRRRNVVVLGNAPARTLFPAVDPDRQAGPHGRHAYTVVGVFGKRPNPLGGTGPTSSRSSRTRPGRRSTAPTRFRIFGIVHRDIAIIVIPREGVTQAAAMREVEEIMRARHGLRLDQENDFDIATQAALLQFWERISGGIFLALVVISSIALMVGGIGVMAIMTISVTERTREIGVRKALGARRREILWQFLLEAVFLTSLGGVRRHRARRRHRLADQRPVRLPHLAALVVLRHRHRLLGRRSASSSASSRPSRRPGSTRSKPSGTSRSGRARPGTSVNAAPVAGWGIRPLAHSSSRVASGPRTCGHHKEPGCSNARLSMPPPSRQRRPGPAIPGPARRSSPARSSSPPAR